MRNTEYPQQITPKELLNLLSNSFLSTFILNASSSSNYIPGAQTYSSLLEPASSRRRRSCSTVVYDDEGLVGGFANIVALSIVDDGFNRPVYYLVGGISLLEQYYPALVCCAGNFIDFNERNWARQNELSSGIDDDNYSIDSLDSLDDFSLLDSSPTSSPEFPVLSLQDTSSLDKPIHERTMSSNTIDTIINSNPINNLRHIQKHLIKAVWYNKIHPVGDIQSLLYQTYFLDLTCLQLAYIY